jgi:hypothetical protein
LFELADAVLCGDGPVSSLVELSLVGEHRRSHGGLYAAVARGRVDAGRLRWALAKVPLPRAVDGRLVLAVDVTCWLRPDPHTSPQRILCHTYGRGKDQHIPVPGWPYSIVCALEPGRSSWTAPLDALRLAPGMTPPPSPPSSCVTWSNGSSRPDSGPPATRLLERLSELTSVLGAVSTGLGRFRCRDHTRHIMIITQAGPMARQSHSYADWGRPQ